MDCIFCKIVKGEIPSAKVFEDEKILAFLDINPVHHGHVLVIPKEHHHKLEETPDNVVSDIFVQAKKIMIAVKKALKSDFVVLSVVGTDVPHLHVHVIPRWHDDGLSNFWPTKKYKESDEMRTVADKIRATLY